MNLQEHKRVIISGGGTGGHIFPAISVANALKRLNERIEILFVGAENRMEMEKIPEAGYKIIGLPVEGFQRRRIWRNFIVVVKLMKSLVMANRIVKEFNPHVVVGVGGYASGPVLRQAGRMGIPTLIQEQNSYAGVTNKLLAKKASVICVAYDGMDRYFPAKKIIKTGNPVRHNFDNLAELREEAFSFFSLTKDIPVVLVLGGSQGAGSVNKGLSENISRLKEAGCQWLWQTGTHYFENVKTLVSLTFSDNIFVHGFINRMDLAYAASDLIISRAGAGTISELCLVGKPVILIPSPNVAEDHQTMNAEALSDRGAAVLIPDNEAVSRLVEEAVRLITDKSGMISLSENISMMAERDADIKIAKEVLKLAGE